jgi:excisionase family DNA binding protein
MQPERKRAYSIREFCEAWSLSRSTVYRMFANGQLSGRKVGRRTLIPNESIEAWASRLPEIQRRPD